MLYRLALFPVLPLGLYYLSEWSRRKEECPSKDEIYFVVLYFALVLHKYYHCYSLVL